MTTSWPAVRPSVTWTRPPPTAPVRTVVRVAIPSLRMVTTPVPVDTMATADAGTVSASGARAVTIETSARDPELRALPT